MVSVIWFGTVATIVATTGTVLALYRLFFKTLPHLQNEKLVLQINMHIDCYIFPKIKQGPAVCNKCPHCIDTTDHIFAEIFRE